MPTYTKKRRPLRQRKTVKRGGMTWTDEQKQINDILALIKGSKPITKDELTKDTESMQVSKLVPSSS